MNKPGDVVADYVVTVDMFNCQIGIFYTRDEANAVGERLGAKRIPKSANAAALRHRDKKGVTWYLAWLPTDCPVDIIAHECVHLAILVLDGHDVKATPKNHEHLAYLTGYLVRSILNRRAEHKRQVKKPARKGKGKRR